MNTWMTVKDVTAESPRSKANVTRALQSGELRGQQAAAGCKWLIARTEFEAWMRRGAPIIPAKRRRLHVA